MLYNSMLKVDGNLELDISELEYPVESVYFELVQFWKNETRLAVSSETEERNSLMFLL